MIEREVFTYKRVGETELHLHVFWPQHRDGRIPIPAIVFFFGGGWTGGKPEQLFPQCEYLATRGMAAMSAEYRVRDRHGTTPFECVADGKSAIRWLRSHAEDLGIDSKRIAAGGASAGGHVAACAGIINRAGGQDEDESVSSTPDALILFNPVLDVPAITATGHGAEDLTLEQQRELSPALQVGGGLPPTIVLHGTADQAMPFDTVERFSRLMKGAGNICELVPFEGKGHGFFNHGRDGNIAFRATLQAIDEFLCSLGYLGS